MADIRLIDTAITKKTQDMLGQLIRKSVLTDKLLSKPPFRFLHDVITSVKHEDTRLLVMFWLALFGRCGRLTLIVIGRITTTLSGRSAP